MALGRADALAGYICHATAASVIDGMCRQLAGTNQRSFTWTGPFGGGKSSLAVALASALHSDKALRARARQALRLEEKPAFDKAFPVRKGWMLVPVVGRRGSVVSELGAAIRKAQGKTVDGRNKPNAQGVIAELLQEAKDRQHDGTLLEVGETERATRTRDQRTVRATVDSQQPRAVPPYPSGSGPGSFQVLRENSAASQAPAFR